MTMFRTWAFLCLLTAALWGQTRITIEDNHNSWGWQAVVMNNDLITVASVPVIGARIMQYDLGAHSSIFVNAAEIGKTYKPDQNKWFNYGGYKVWPAPQSVWSWPPPAILDAGPWSAEIVDNSADSVALFVKSQKETWSKTPNLSMERRTVIYKNSSRVKVEQSIINQGAKEAKWSVWDVTQAIVNHPGEKDYVNFWVYFPIKTEGSVFGPTGVKTSAASSAWKGEVAPGVYGVQFKPEGKKIFADSPEGWIAYVDEREGYAYVKVFEVYEGQDYPDDGARNEVWINNNPFYLEVEVVSPIWPIAANGGKITFVEDWYAAKVNGPILAVNHLGAVESHLQFDPSNGELYGAYGVFYVGVAKLIFLDAAGAEVGGGGDFKVTPLEKFVIEQKIDVPKSAATAEIRLFDADGKLLGVLDTVSADQITGVKSEPVPASFTLLRSYPNPFNPTTTLEFNLPNAQSVKLTIFSADGRAVTTLADGVMHAGSHRLLWEASQHPAGIYLARLETAQGLQVLKMLLIK